MAGDIKIEVRNPGTEDAYPDVANKSTISKKINKIQRQLDTLSEELCFDTDDVPSIVCEHFNLRLEPFKRFQTYWVDRIIAAPAFSNREREETGEGWSIDSSPFGWLTKRHGAALQKHGYTYKFSFWAEEIGETRGNLWVQTDKGPLILTDKTDSISLESNFPVQVSSISGKKLFRLSQRDVPDRLMRSGQDVPTELSKKASNAKAPSDWKDIFNWFRGRR